MQQDALESRDITKIAHVSLLKKSPLYKQARRRNYYYVASPRMADEGDIRYGALTG